MEIRWTDCNLVWDSHERPAMPPQPDLTERARAELGMSYQDSTNRVPEELFADYLKDNNSDKIAESKYAVIREHHAFVAKHSAWFAEQPENIEWQKRYTERIAAANQHSFCGRGLNKPGTLVVVEDDGKERTLMIGSIDPNGGTCGCCGDVQAATLVKRYAVIWSGE